MQSTPPPTPKRSSISIVCVGALSSSSARSRATDLLWRTVKSSMPNDCSTSPQSRSPLPSEPSNWSMPEMAARALRAMSSTTTSLSRSNGCRANSKAQPPSRRILTRPDRSPSSHGSPHASAGGTATMESQGQRPCMSAGTNSNHPCWLRPCYSWAKSVNPVARAGEGTDRADAVFAANRAVGSLAFSVKQVAGKTRRAMVHEAGSLRVRCPGAPAAELEAVIINTAGGIAGGDRFALDIAAGQGTRLVVTTAAAEKIYRTLGPDSTVDVKLDVAAGATLAWLPQETILFGRARLTRSIEADF